MVKLRWVVVSFVRRRKFLENVKTDFLNALEFGVECQDIFLPFAMPLTEIQSGLNLPSSFNALCICALEGEGRFPLLG